MNGTATRLTLYAVISAIEADLRNLVLLHLDRNGGAALLSDEVHSKALDRLQKEDPVLIGAPLFSDLLNFVDLGDLYQVLCSQRDSLPTPLAKQLRKAGDKIGKLVGVRNRVMHMRPLLVDDFAHTIDLARDLSGRDDSNWREVTVVLEQLRSNPGYVLSLQIPAWDTADRVTHNLPIPDFDETGFIGREDVVKQLMKQIQGPYPVITVVGEGGIGKTALVLRVAYDALDDPNCRYDAIIWSSSKTTQLTPSQVVAIEGAISSSLGLLQAISNELTGVKTADPMEEVLEYLRTFKILLIIDNLETVLDSRVTHFLEQLSGQSKVLITSRVGLGAFEVPVKLQPLTEAEAVQLIRHSARARGADELVRTGNLHLREFCRRMGNNPGYIKWFVAAVQAGQRPELILQDPGIFLRFCMSNVYEFLREEAKQVLSRLQAFPSELTLAELSFLCEELDTDQLQKALQNLLQTNMVRMSSVPRSSSYESLYSISDLARDYLNIHHPLDRQTSSLLLDQRRRLVAVQEAVTAGRRSNPYSFYSITMRSTRDAIMAKQLSDIVWNALHHYLEEAQAGVEKARTLAPEYFEVHRVEALVRVQQTDYLGARIAYEAALELEPDAPQLHYWYGGFLMRYLDDLEGALAELRKAAGLDPGACIVHLEVARAELYLLMFAEARQTLDSLLERDGMAQRERTKLFDLHLQWYSRFADHQCGQGETLAAFENLRTLREEFLKCPKGLRDRAMRRRLEKVIPTAFTCQNHLDDQEARDEMQLVIDWLRHEVSTVLPESPWLG